MCYRLVMADDVTKPLGEPEAASGSTGDGVRAIGRYVTVRELGRGGAGTVYSAFDPHLDRKVALKLLHRGGSALIREAKLLAKLSHPNIVTVFDSGIHEERAFLIMELIDGVHLGQWVETTPSNAERMTALIGVARGLEAAHAAGVVHGDVKPSNVLVGRDGVARLSDFGIARQLESEDWGAEAGPVGTPAYMAPEQHDGGAASPAADQYSFCLTAWETLAGGYPFTSAATPQSGASTTLSEAKGEARQLPAGDGGLPRALAAALRRGLDPDPGARWPSVAALRSAMEATTRKRPTLPYLAGAGAIAVGAAAVVASAADEDRCDGAREHVEAVWGDPQRDGAWFVASAPFAVQTRARVVQRLDRYAEHWALRHREACEATERGEQSERVLDLQMACLRRARVQLEATVRVLAEADGETVARAPVVVDSLPEPSRCRDIDGLSELTLPAESIADEVEQLQALITQSEVDRLAGKLDAHGLTADAMQRIEALGYAPLRATALLEQSHFAFETGDMKTAERAARDAIGVAVAAGQWSDGVHAVAAVLRIVGDSLARPAEALMLEPLGQGLVERSGDPVDEAIFRTQIAAIQIETGQHDEALAHIEAALAILADRDSRAAALARLEAQSHYASVLRALERFEDARREDDATVAAFAEEFGEGHPHTALTRHALGQSLVELGEYPAALQEFERSHRALVEFYGKRDRRVAIVQQNLAATLGKLGRFDEAVAAFEEALGILAETSTDKDPSVALARLKLGGALIRANRLDDAEIHVRRAVEELDARLGPDHPSNLRSAVMLPRLLQKQGRLAEARRAVEALLPRQEKALPASDGHLASTRALYGELLLASGDRDAAARVLAQAWAVLKDNGYPSLQAKVAFTYAKASEGERRTELLAAARTHVAAATDDVASLREAIETFEP